MPDPTLSDVLRAIEQMQNDVTFIKDKVTDIPAIKDNVQAVRNVFVPCPKCNGTGTVEVSVVYPDRIGPDTELVACSGCAGVKYVQHGYHSV